MIEMVDMGGPRTGSANRATADSLQTRPSPSVSSTKTQDRRSQPADRLSGEETSTPAYCRKGYVLRLGTESAFSFNPLEER